MITENGTQKSEERKEFVKPRNLRDFSGKSNIFENYRSTMVLLKYLRNHFKPEIYGPGYKGLFKQGMNEHPAIVFCCIGSVLTLVISHSYLHYLCQRTSPDRKRFLYRYNVYRVDDERLDWLDLPPKLAAEVAELRAKAK